jgi:hypothetical protein
LTRYGWIDVFVNKVYARTGKKILGEDADAFFASARDIIGRLPEGISTGYPP